MSDAPLTRPSLLVRLRDPSDERAWEEFLEIYTPLVLRLARRRGLQDADAADLSQEVFRAVAGAIERWDPDPGRGSFRAWLATIARNLITNALAAQRRQPRGTGRTDVARRLDEQAAPAPDETALYDAEYRRRLFQWAVEQVRGEFRESTWQAFWRTGVGEESPADVAESLGISVGAVYVYRNRVMARLRRRIEQVEGP